MLYRSRQQTLRRTLSSAKEGLFGVRIRNVVRSANNTLPYLALPCLTLPYLTSPHLTSPHLTSPHLTLPYLTLPCLTLPYLTLPCLTLPYLTLPYLTLPVGADACTRQTPSTEATARAQCASPTDLKVDRTSLKLWQTSGGEANGCHSAYPVKE